MCEAFCYGNTRRLMYTVAIYNRNVSVNCFLRASNSLLIEILLVYQTWAKGISSRKCSLMAGPRLIFPHLWTPTASSLEDPYFGSRLSPGFPFILNVLSQSLMHPFPSPAWTFSLDSRTADLTEYFHLGSWKHIKFNMSKMFLQTSFGVFNFSE